MAESKIIKYGFQQEVLRLSVQPGMTGEKIAEILTAKLENRDSIGQSTVSRFLTKARQERQEQTQVIVQEHIKAHVPADLTQIEEVQSLYYAIFRNQENLQEPMIKDETGKPLVFDLKARTEAGMRLVDIIFRKLKQTGQALPEDEGDEEIDDFKPISTRSGIRGIVRQLRTAGFTGPNAEEKKPRTEGSPGVLS